MRIAPKNKEQWHSWWAWHPVRTKEGVLVWLEPVQRRWNPDTNLRIIDPYDRGEYEGGYEYTIMEKQ